MKKQLKTVNLTVYESGVVHILKHEQFGHTLMRYLAQKNAVALFIYGQDRDVFFEDLLSQLTQIKAERIRNGYLNRAEYKRVVDWLTYLSKCPLYIDDSVSLDACEIDNHVHRLLSELNRQSVKFGLIVCRMPREENSKRKRKEMFYIGLREMAQKLNLPVIVEEYKVS